MSQLYSLEDAAAKLNMSVDALREMAKKRTIRSFQDRGTLRFKSEDIEAMLSQPKDASTGETDLADFQLEMEPASPTPSPETTKPVSQDTPLILDLDLGADDFTLPMDDQPATQAPGIDPSTSSGEILNLQGENPDSSLEFSLDLTDDGSGVHGEPSSLMEPPKESPFELSEPVIDLGSDTIGLMGDSDSDSASTNQPAIGDLESERQNAHLDDSMLTSQGASSSIEVQAPVIDDSSEFELSIDESGSFISSADSQLDIGSGTELSTDDSGSEFELTMEDGVENSSEVDLSQGSDLESSDFELEATESDSGSQIVDIEGGGDADMMEQTAEFASADEMEIVDDSSSSQVVAVEEIEEAVDEVEEIEEVEQVEEEIERTPVYAATETPWGVLPALVLIPGVLILAVVSLMSFELMRGLYGYHKGTGFTSVILKPIAEMFTELPK